MLGGRPRPPGRRKTWRTGTYAKHEDDSEKYQELLTNIAVLYGQMSDWLTIILLAVVIAVFVYRMRRGHG